MAEDIIDDILRSQLSDEDRRLYDLVVALTLNHDLIHDASQGLITLLDDLAAVGVPAPVMLCAIETAAATLRCAAREAGATKREIKAIRKQAKSCGRQQYEDRYRPILEDEERQMAGESYSVPVPPPEGEQ
jgi:hypothetical protein